MDTSISRKQKFEEEGDPGFFFTRKKSRTGKQKRRRSSIAPRRRATPSAASTPARTSAKANPPAKGENSISTSSVVTTDSAQPLSSSADSFRAISSTGAFSQSVLVGDIADRGPLLAVIAEDARNALGEEHNELVDSFIQELQALPEDCPDAEAFTLHTTISELEAQRKKLQQEIAEWTEQEKRAKQLVDDAKRKFEQCQRQSTLSKSWEDMASELPTDQQEMLRRPRDYTECASLLRQRQQHLFSVRDNVKVYQTTLSTLMRSADNIIAAQREEIVPEAARQAGAVPGNVFDNFRHLLSSPAVAKLERRNTSRNSPRRPAPLSATDDTASRPNT